MGAGLSTQLEYNSLYQQNLDELEVYLRKVRCQDKGLTELDVSNRFLGVQGARAASEAIARAKYLRSLNCSYNNLGNPPKKKRTGRLVGGPAAAADESFSPAAANDVGMPYLADGLAQNSSLTYLNLAGNNLELRGAQAVATFLRQNSTLKELVLFNNNIGDDAMPELCDALRQNTRLTKLNLDYNNITDAGAELLRRALDANRSLVAVSLKDNEGVSERWLREIQTRLEANKGHQAERERAEREAEEEERARAV
eukprot:RCo052332